MAQTLPNMAGVDVLESKMETDGANDILVFVVTSRTLPGLNPWLSDPWHPLNPQRLKQPFETTRTI
eukprot:2528501-Prymnesium_polylepis.1